MVDEFRTKNIAMRLFVEKIISTKTFLSFIVAI